MAFGPRFVALTAFSCLCVAARCPLAFAAEPRASDPWVQADSDGASDGEKTLDAAVAVLADETIRQPIMAHRPKGMETELFQLALGAHGDLGPLVAYLDEQATGLEDPVHRSNAARLAGHLTWRFGDLDEALERFDRFLVDAPADLDARLSRARLLDALGRAKDALEAYSEAVPSIEDDAVRARARLRMALMSMESGDEEQKDALAKFASEEGQPLELRNRSAVVLALLGRPAEAADLYRVPDAATDQASGPAGSKEKKAARKAAANGELRIAEWAVRAEDWPRAQEAAWRAMELGTVKREIRYALTLLAEAHRGDESLEALLERFDVSRDQLPPEAREAWIDLLRETGHYEDAIQMALGDEAAEFSREERRRLLEMYREAGRAEEMVTVYREWIAQEPAELVWRQGLSRHYLETGNREAASLVWTDWFDVFESAGRPVEDPLLASESMEALGLDELAMRAAEVAMDQALGGSGPEASAPESTDGEAALLFLYDLHRDRGRLEDARGALERLDQFAEPGSPARMPLSDCFERLGEVEEAVRVLEEVKAARGVARAGEDLEMRLAWLYSEVGREEAALDLWRDLWTRVKSVARGRYVEDRMMTVAARLGVLADIAVELERELAAGTATEKDSGLLVRLYTKVGDSVSAAEIVDEFLAQTGGTELEALTEKARVYLACNDYYHYEKAVGRLIEIDPEGKPDYFRQLAMSQLERGKPDEARETLMELKSLPGEVDDSAPEFEAGVLALSGMREEAIASYRRGLSAHPERIDSYLLMAGLMKEVGETDRAVGMFQYLAETADRDDLFTIAIDGLMNMLVDAPPRPKMLQWARRITLERLAGRADAPYLYQLLSDLTEETGDQDGQLAALENSLAAAGPRRASVLRELMELSKPAPGSFAGPGRDGDRPKQLAFGRRLVGLGELVPPEVYLDLGDAFLDAGDVASAARTFDLTREFPDGAIYQQQSAERFEKAGFVDEAVERYSRVLSASPSNVPLLAKVGELKEALGDDDAAAELYARGFGILLGRKPLFERAEEEPDADELRFRPRNLDEFDQYKERVLVGLLSTMPDGAAVAAFLEEQRAEIRKEVPQGLAAQELTLDGEASEEETAPRIAQHPRIEARAEIVRRVAFASGEWRQAETMDRWLGEAFPGDEQLVESALEARVRWGRSRSAQAFVAEVVPDPELRKEWLAKLGSTAPDAAGVLSLDQSVSMVLGAHAAGNQEALRKLLARVDMTTLTKENAGRVEVLVAAARSTGDPEILLRIARDWLRFDVAEGTSQYLLENRVDTILELLDPETGLAYARYFVGLVLDDPEKNARYVTALPGLAQKFGDRVVETEDVRRLLDGFGDKYAWGLGPVLALLPASDRVGAVRSVWPKLEAANRASFLLDLVTETQEELGPDMADFVKESFPGALEEADDFIEYSVRQLIDVEHSHELVAELGAITRTVKPGVKVAEAVEMVHRMRDPGVTVAHEEAGRVWSDLVRAGSDDWSLQSARTKLEEVSGDDAVPQFLEVLDAVEAQDGGSVDLTLARVGLLQRAERDAEARDVLLAAVRDGDGGSADEEQLLEALRRIYQRSGERVRAAETLERLAELTEDTSKKKRHLRQLVKEWTELDAPERALAASEELGADEGGGGGGIPGLPPGLILAPGTMISIGGVMYSSDDAEESKGLKKSFEDVVRSLEAGEEAEAALIMRRLWRQFPEGQPAPRPFYASRYRRLPLANLTLPDDAGEDESAAERSEEPALGGLLGYEPEEPEPEPDPPSAYDLVTKSARLNEELTRFLRTANAAELDRLQKLLEGRLAREVEDRGVDDVMDELLGRASDGTMGRADQIRLLGLLDAHPERSSGAAADALADLVNAGQPRDAAQVRRLGRVFAKGGKPELAQALYRWCALIPAGLRSYGGDEDLDVVTSVSSRELVKEARDHLEGAEQIALIEMVLELSRPGDVSPWQRRSYDELVLSTWAEILPPAEALERARSTAEAAIDLSTGLRRSVARRAAPLFLYGGDMDSALEAVEVGIASLDPDDVVQPEERWYREDATVSGSLSTADLRRLLPVGGAGIEDPKGWFQRFSDALETWALEERLERSAAVRPLAIVATRLGEVGAPEMAASLLERLGQWQGLGASDELWLVDALRLNGITEAADAREEALLMAGKLLPARLPAVLKRLGEDRGPKAVVAAESVVASVRHPGVIQAMLEAYEELSDTEMLELWTAREAAAEDARAALAKK